jgi:dipeptidase D
MMLPTYRTSLQWSLLALAAMACGSDRSTMSRQAEQAATGGPRCDGACVVSLFRELAPIYRPSGEESLIRDRLFHLVREASASQWNGRLEILGPDPVGNFVVRVPATGAYAARTLPPIALQAHMDMVLAATDVPPGGDLKAYFREHGVRLQEKDGRLQSVDQKTTIGADDTVGCALELRYALDPTIAHPPLELVFTISEEVGLRGAAQFDTATLPLRAPVMIGLDGDDSAKLVYGSQGAVRRSVSGPLLTEVATSAKLARITVSKMLGGHSGADIHRERLNAVVVFGAVASVVLETGSALGLVSAAVGDLGGLNKIPNSLEFVVAGSSTLDVAELRATVETRVRALAQSHPGEAGNPDINVSVAEEPAPTASMAVIDRSGAVKLARALVAIESATNPLNGVISQHADFPNKVNTSSNLGALELKLATPAAAQRTATFGFMTRSFSANELRSTSERLITHLKDAFPNPSGAAAVEISGYDPWLQDPASWLVRLGTNLEIDGRRPIQRTSVIAVGLEPSFFIAKFPGLEVITLGPTVTDAHTVRESVSIQSILDLTRSLDAFLTGIAEAPEFAMKGALP